MSTALQTRKPPALGQPDGTLPAISTWEQMSHMAKDIHAAGVFPAFKNWQAILVAMLKGRELGVPATTAMQQVYVVNGKATAGAELMLALIERDYGRGSMYIDLAECSDERAVIMYRDPASGAYKRYEYTFAMAEQAKLTTKDTWKQYPGNMLRWRAVSNVAKAVFPASIGGLYTPEEMGAEVAFDDDGNVIVDVSAAEARAGQFNSGSSEASPRQMKYLFAVARERGWHEDDVRDCARYHYDVTSLSDLTRQQISHLIERVQSGERWVDPRQQAMTIDVPAVAHTIEQAVERGIERALADDPEGFDGEDEASAAVAGADESWTAKGSLVRWLPSGDPQEDIEQALAAARTATTTQQMTELRRFVKELELDADADLMGEIVARHKELSGNGNGHNGR